MAWFAVFPLTVITTSVSVVASSVPSAGAVVMPLAAKLAKATSVVLASDLVKVTTKPVRSRFSPAV